MNVDRLVCHVANDKFYQMSVLGGDAKVLITV